MRKKWITITVISITAALLIACVLGIFAFIRINQAQSETGGVVLKDKKYMTFDSYANYKYLFLKLDINASNCKDVVVYNIKDPSGNIIDSGSISSSDKMLTVDKNIAGKKGTWYIEFKNAAEDEKIGVTYRIEGRNVYESPYKRPVE